MTLTPRGKVPASPLQLTIIAAKTLDAEGRPIDGDHDGQPGGNFQTTLRKAATRPVEAPPIGLAGRVIDALLGGGHADTISLLPYGQRGISTIPDEDPAFGWQGGSSYRRAGFADPSSDALRASADLAIGAATRATERGRVDRPSQHRAGADHVSGWGSYLHRDDVRRSADEGCRAGDPSPGPDLYCCESWRRGVVGDDNRGRRASLPRRDPRLGAASLSPWACTGVGSFIETSSTRTSYGTPPVTRLVTDFGVASRLGYPWKSADRSPTWHQRPSTVISRAARRLKSLGNLVSSRHRLSTIRRTRRRRLPRASDARSGRPRAASEAIPEALEGVIRRGLEPRHAFRPAFREFQTQLRTVLNQLSADAVASAADAMNLQAPARMQMRVSREVARGR